MPSIGAQRLIDAVIAAVEESGYSAIFLRRKGQVHPREFLITSPSEESRLLWVYIWTLTFGGRQSLPDEYRIQMTTVESPLKLNPHGPTVLMGFEPELRLFAGFDIGFHRQFTEGSPMVSIDIKVVKQALQDGLSFHRKSNREIAIGIRPDQFVNYANHATQLHKLGRQAATYGLMSRAAALEAIPAEEVASLPEERKRIVQTVSRLSRDGNFKKQVLSAYGNRCAVTRAQLKLVDAAHILPVGAPESVDDVCNGIALSPTYHRAYDNGLIYLDEEYTMQINTAKANELASLNLAGGIEQFKSCLGRILLPQTVDNDRMHDSLEKPTSTGCCVLVLPRDCGDDARSLSCSANIPRSTAASGRCWRRSTGCGRPGLPRR